MEDSWATKQERDQKEVARYNVGRWAVPSSNEIDAQGLTAKIAEKEAIAWKDVWWSR